MMAVQINVMLLSASSSCRAKVTLSRPTVGPLMLVAEQKLRYCRASNAGCRAKVTLLSDL